MSDRSASRLRALLELAEDSEASVQLSPALRAELESALEEADQEEGISGEALLERLRKYG